MSEHVTPECGSCDHWRFRSGLSGECWRFPPIPSVMANANGDTAFEQLRPWTQRQENCGEWTPRGTLLSRAEKSIGAPTHD